MDIFIGNLNLNSKYHDKSKLAVNQIALVTASNLFSLEVIQKCQHCQLRVIQESSNKGQVKFEYSDVFFRGRNGSCRHNNLKFGHKWLQQESVNLNTLQFELPFRLQQSLHLAVSRHFYCYFPILIYTEVVMWESVLCKKKLFSKLL